jgi:hypothetical protein
VLDDKKVIDGISVERKEPDDKKVIEGATVKKPDYNNKNVIEGTTERKVIQPIIIENDQNTIVEKKDIIVKNLKPNHEKNTIDFKTQRKNLETIDSEQDLINKDQIDAENRWTITCLMIKMFLHRQKYNYNDQEKKIEYINKNINNNIKLKINSLNTITHIFNDPDIYQSNISAANFQINPNLLKMLKEYFLRLNYVDQNECLNSIFNIILMINLNKNF